MEMFIKGCILGLIPLILFSASVVIIGNSDKPSIEYVKEKVRPGYQTEPAKYIVEASYAKYFHDSRKPVLIIFSFLLIVFGTGYIVYFFDKRGLKNVNYVLFSIWILGAIMIFAPMAKLYGSSSYQSTLTVQEYEQNKNNLDSLFPAIESTEK